MRRPRVIRILLAAFWLVAMAWYLRFEAFPGYFTHTLGGYRDLLSEGQLFMDSWMKILFRGQPIGFSHTAVEVADDDPLEHYRISNRTLLSLNLMGERQNVSVQSGGSLDMLHKLQRFHFSLNARRYSLRVDGERRGEQAFRVVTRSDQGQSIEMVNIPDDVILYSPMTEMSLARLRPGEEMRVRTFDPSSRAIAHVQVKALRRESVEALGRTNDALVLAVAYGGMELLSWVDEQGRSLRQDTPLGGLTLLGSERQELLYRSNLVAEVRVRGAAWPAAATALTNRADYLRSSTFVQADHPDVRARAERLVAGLTDERAKARAIFRWVFESVRKEPTVSMPSALDVLKRMEGDCNEHTYLFVALARATGLPAAIRIGLLRKDNAFWYHAWPAVFVGGWVEMDPTTGQELVDAGHLVLLEGELADQLQLMPLFGRLGINVIGEPAAGGHP